MLITCQGSIHNWIKNVILLFGMTLLQIKVGQLQGLGLQPTVVFVLLILPTVSAISRALSILKSIIKKTCPLSPQNSGTMQAFEGTKG